MRGGRHRRWPRTPGYRSARLMACARRHARCGPGAASCGRCAQGKAAHSGACGGSHRSAEGMNILGAHIDSPAPRPQAEPAVRDATASRCWTRTTTAASKTTSGSALPLALHGVVAKTDGAVVEVNIGDDPADPVFCVTDLLPHLAFPADG